MSCILLIYFEKNAGSSAQTLPVGISRTNTQFRYSGCKAELYVIHFVPLRLDRHQLPLKSSYKCVLPTAA